MSLPILKPSKTVFCSWNRNNLLKIVHRAPQDFPSSPSKLHLACFASRFLRLPRLWLPSAPLPGRLASSLTESYMQVPSKLLRQTFSDAKFSLNHPAFSTISPQISLKSCSYPTE